MQPAPRFRSSYGREGARLRRPLGARRTWGRTREVQHPDRGERHGAGGCQRVTLVVRSERDLDYDLRLIAVAPGQPVVRVVATITGDTGRPIQNVQRRGFEIDLTRAAPNRWRGVARFARPGRWRVVVPNGAPVGVVIPNGVAMLTLAVR